MYHEKGKINPKKRPGKAHIFLNLFFLTLILAWAIALVPDLVQVLILAMILSF